MKLLIISACLLTISLAVPKTVINFRNLSKPNTLDSELYKNGRIINGNSATLHQFPHQAFLEMRSPESTWYCSGSLIDSRVILTAGYCGFQATEANVILGAQNPFVNETDQKIYVSNKIRVHEKFDFGNRINDIALIILPEDVITVANKIETIRVGSVNHNNDAGRRIVRMSGWGLTDSGENTLSKKLMYIDSTIIGTEDCGNYYEGITDNQLCTKLGASCTGDTGGPLVISPDDASPPKTNAIIGIISYGAQNCLTKYPTVFTNVFHYQDWIIDNKN